MSQSDACIFQMLFGQQFIGKYYKFRQQIDSSVIKLNQNISKRIK